MANVEPLSEKFKNFSFFWQKLAGKLFCQKLMQHSVSLKGVLSINLKFLAFQSLLYRQDSKIYHLPSQEIRKLKFWSTITHRKKISATKTLEYDRSWACRKVTAKTGWIQLKGAEKTRFKSWNADWCHGRGKKRKILTCPCAKRLRFARIIIIAKVLSATREKVRDLLTTTLTRCLCNAREHVPNFG